METATLGGGCFWCTEAIFKRLKGVVRAVPGYSGGTVENPSYKDICTGNTGHAEAAQITFDPHVLPYKRLLEIFFHLHDPTTLNRQGSDEGTQYRSVIFYHSPVQKKVAESLKKELEKANTFKKPIVTQIMSFKKFYEAEDNHKNYYEKNSYQPYCQFVIDPKLTKLLTSYRDDCKLEYATH